LGGDAAGGATRKAPAQAELRPTSAGNFPRGPACEQRFCRFYCFNAAKGVRRLKQRLLQDDKIVIRADLLLQLPQIRDHLYEALWPDGLQHLKFIIEVLHADVPFMKGFIVTLPQLFSSQLSAESTRNEYREFRPQLAAVL
jgi:hypothetical protein